MWIVFDSVFFYCMNVKNEFFCFLGICFVIGDFYVIIFDGKMYIMYLKECLYVMLE